MRPVLQGPLPHAIAHRGSRLLWPENTMVAFQGAVSLGYRWLETDLHVTRDGVLVCLHDDRLDRTTDASGPVWDLDSSELGEVDAGFRFRRDGDHPYRGAGIRIPALAEVVEAFPEVRLVVDLKQDGLEEPLATLVDERDLWDRVVVGSFSDRRLMRFRQLTDGRVATSTGPRETLAVWRAARTRRRTPPAVADAVQVPRRYRGLSVVNRRTVPGFHRGGYQVHVWTVNQRSEMERLIALGVDGIITDRPDLLREVLEGRGLWA